MIDDSILKNFLDQFDSLEKVVIESYNRSIEDPPDHLFYEHQNVFIKSYLVSACSMLEAFIQDLANAYLEHMQYKINSANIPLNIITWITEHEKAKLEFKRLEAKKSRKDISELISPNYWKTMKAFERVGIDLSASNISSYKDFITTTVEKRNKIVHNNDAASDLSFTDIISTIKKFRDYGDCLFKSVCADHYLN